MGFRKISSKILVCLLPVVAVAMTMLTAISASYSTKLVNEQITERMRAELSAQEGKMNEYLQSISELADVLAGFVEMTYTDFSLEDYEKVLGNAIMDNDIALGSGIWFEPYVYDAEQEYVGPYIYKDGDGLTTTYDYSNAEYDYFNQEYYTMTVTASGALFTDPYYDPTSATVMSSCAAPIIVEGKFIGCVTVDISLDTIVNLVGNIKVGSTGSAILITAPGIYIGGMGEEILQSAINITEDTNASLAEAGKAILANVSGEGTYVSDKGTMNIFYDTIDITGWKLILQMEQKELTDPIRLMTIQLIVVALIAMALVIGIVIIVVQSVTRGIKKVNSLAGSLSDGDFTVRPIDVRGRDEVASMSTSLNTMYANNKNMISNIKAHAANINESSERLNHEADNLSKRFAEIKTFMNDVNSAMLTTSAATEEVNASSEEVLSNTNYLVTETAESKKMATEIRSRATEVGNSSRAAYDSAITLADEFKNKLAISMENAKVVNSIQTLASSISDIAEQVNLLSLNASIEAARAGDAGRGFAVVASEIGSLANSTSDTVGEIQQTISEVQAAFNGLADDAKGLLEFLTDTVAPDYQKFVGVAEQYGQDAENIDQSSDKISEMADNIKFIMQEVTDAIQSISEATQDTTELSSKIMQNIEVVSDTVDEVATMSEEQEDIAGDLNEQVNKFRLD